MSVTDVTEQVQARRQLERAQAEQAQLMQELSAANKRLSETNKDLTDANEELQVANEELVLTHEELQASIEEFETTNEELQATNEELETNNEELQATNEELETTNDELRARSAELQELTTLLESERGRLAQMVELAPFSIVVLRGPSLLVEAYNPRYARLLEGRVVQGRPLEEIMDLFWELGTDMVRLAREVYRQDVVRITPRTLTYLPKGQGTGEPQASYLVFTLVPSHDATGHVDGVVIYAADETEQRAREAEQEREQLQLIFDHTPVALLALYEAPTAQAMMMSPTGFRVMQRAYGLQPHEVIGRPWFDAALALSRQEAERLWQSVLERRASIRTPEVHYTFPDGQRTVWDRTLTPILDKEQPERILFVLVSAVEMTEQVQARQEVERLDQLKEDFVSFATHELRTPLTALLGNAQILEKLMRRQMGSLSPEEVQRLNLNQALTLLERMTQQVSKMNQLIAEMLDATRLRGNVFKLEYSEDVDFVALSRRVVEQFSHADHQITLKTNEERVVGSADEGRIEQVLNNLISNALNYSPKDKPVTVTVQSQGNPPGEVLISVHDEGQGISQEEQAHIFDRFYRVPTQRKAKVEGLGLGLYIAQQIVVQHGGRIWVESQPGQGTTFSISLPMKRP
jgi:two-component system CheB/CheR fusion protein